jgi:fibronectin type 3 domain-containing protein
LFASDKASESLHLNVYQGIVTLAWAESGTATSYNVYRSTTSGGYYAKIGSSTTMSYVDNTATPGFIYYYVVTAVNPLATPPESAYSEQVSASLE